VQLIGETHTYHYKILGLKSDEGVMSNDINIVN